MDGGLNRFDPARETFTHFRHDPDDGTTVRVCATKKLAESYARRNPDRNLYCEAWHVHGVKKAEG